MRDDILLRIGILSGILNPCKGTTQTGDRHTMAKQTPTYWRQFAIGMLSELYLPTSPDGVPLNLVSGYGAPSATAQEVAHNILKLQSIGRTDRWRKIIAGWAGLVITEGNSPQNLRYAFLQGMIRASHEA